MFSNSTTICKVVKFLPVVLVYLALFSIYFCYFKLFIFDSKFEKNEYLESHKICFSVVITILVIMITLCHTACVFTNPGNVNFRQIVRIKCKNLEYCAKCDYKRPLRAHHCQQCGKCILKMDHHCPWIANCVGLYNQKYFYLFLFYSTLGCFFAFCGFIQKFMEIDFSYFSSVSFSPDLDEDIKGNITHFDNFDNDTENLNITLINNVTENISNTSNISEDLSLDPFLISFNTVSSFLLFISIASLFFFQSYLILNNMTTIENSKYSPKEKCPYYKPGFMENFKLIMGSSCFIWFFPIIDKENLENEALLDNKEINTNSEIEDNEEYEKKPLNHNNDNANNIYTS